MASFADGSECAASGSIARASRLGAAIRETQKKAAANSTCCSLLWPVWCSFSPTCTGDEAVAEQRWIGFACGHTPPAHTYATVCLGNPNVVHCRWCALKATCNAVERSYIQQLLACWDALVFESNNNSIVSGIHPENTATASRMQNFHRKQGKQSHEGAPG